MQRLAGEEIVERVATEQLHGEPAHYAQIRGGPSEPRVESQVTVLIQTLRRSRGCGRDLDVECEQPLLGAHSRLEPENVRLQVHGNVVAVQGGVRDGNFHTAGR